MLKLKQVSLRRGSKLLFENVTFQAQAGQRLGLIGANGSGKSSLFALLLGQLEVDAGICEVNSGCRFAHVAQESPTGHRPAVEYVMDGDVELRQIEAAIQHAESQPGNGDSPLLYEQFERVDGFTARARASRLLHGLGFAADSHGKAVGEFSGGWRMRLNLARALMCRSDILLLDEPTNHLDLPAILWLERWLLRYQGVLMVVSHDRDFLDATCNRIAHIENGKIGLYAGNYSEFEKQRAEQLARQQAMYRRQQREIRHFRSYVDRFRYKASKARQAQSRLKMLERMTLIAPAHVDSPFRFRFLDPQKQPQHLLRLEEADAGYGDAILSGIDLLISAGDRIGLLGINGAGKSTLVKALADGSTLLGGKRITSKDTEIAYFAQHQLDLLEPDRSPFDHLRGRRPAAKESELRNHLGQFGFHGERIFEPVRPFSGGEKARLVLALMILGRPNLLLLDEPTNHLDLEMRQALSRALVDYSGALVVISHDRHLLRSVCDELLIVHRGRVSRFGDSLDEYPAWLKGEQTGEPLPNAARSKAERQSRDSRREQRRIEAQRRQHMKPFSDRVRQTETRLDAARGKLREIESSLADTGLYTDAGRNEELTELLKGQGRLKSEIQSLETQWLEASEALDQAKSEKR